MGYPAAKAGSSIRKRLVERRRNDWQTRLEDTEELDAEDIEALQPYVEYVSHYGSPVDVVGLSLIGLPLVAGLGYVLTFVAGSILETGAVFSLPILAVRTVIGVGGPLLLAGAILYYLGVRIYRFHLCRPVKTQLEENPSAILQESEDAVPVTREYVMNVGKTT